MLSIQDKIKKLLALSENDNEFEAKLAMGKAIELMEKYNIAKGDLKEEEDRIIHETIDIDNKANWYALLLWGISPAFNCQMIRSRRNGYFSLFGSKGEIETVKIMFQYAKEVINRLAKAEMRDCKKALAMGINDFSSYSYSPKTYMNSFRLGIVNGMRETLSAIAESKKPINNNIKAYAIVLVDKETEIKNLVKDIYPKIVSNRSNCRINDNAFNSGNSNGKNVSFNKQANSGGIRGYLN
jgi:hypothetical protein